MLLSQKDNLLALNSVPHSRIPKCVAALLIGCLKMKLYYFEIIARNRDTSCLVRHGSVCSSLLFPNYALIVHIHAHDFYKKKSSCGPMTSWAACRPGIRVIHINLPLLITLIPSEHLKSDCHADHVPVNSPR